MRRSPKDAVLGLLAFALLPGGTAGAQDIVYVFADGSITRVEGSILQQTEQGLLIRTTEGSELRIPTGEVANVIRGQGSPSANSASERPAFIPAPAARGARYREPSTAFLCSLLLPGGGQFYNGDAAGGTLLLGGALLGALLVANANPYAADYDSDVSLGASLMFASALTSVIMAPIDAASLNRKHGFHASVGAKQDGGHAVALAVAF